MKRNKKPSCAPDLYVYPGGTAENCDFSREWLSIFGARCPEEAEARFGFARSLATSSPMFCRQRECEFTCVPAEVAFRICAIRETFKDSGVLLARSCDQNTLQHNPSPVLAYNAGCNHKSMVEEWRQRVMRDPAEFLNLCKCLDVVPDIWSIYDWSNWLTPIGETSDCGEPLCKRFDAAFFVSCLKERPYVAESACDPVAQVSMFLSVFFCFCLFVSLLNV